MLDYDSTKPATPRSSAGASLVCALLLLSVASGVAFARADLPDDNDLLGPLLFIALAAPLANMPVLLVFRGRLPTAVAVVGWTVAGLASAGVVVFLFVCLLIGARLFTP
jgi:hypothetical protein